MELTGDRGAVTVEAALGLCSLMVMLALAIGAVAAASAQVRCLDAAREAARLVARGESDRAGQAAATIAPAGARVVTRVVGDEVTVEVSSELVGRLPGLTVSGRAVGVLEPGLLAPGPGPLSDRAPGETGGVGPPAPVAVDGPP